MQKLFVFEKSPFSRMHSEGFSFNSGGLGVRVVFAQCCFNVRNRPQAFAMGSLSLTVGRRSQNVTKSSLSRGPFHRKIAWFCCVCDMRYDCVCVWRGVSQLMWRFFVARAARHFVLLHYRFSWPAQHLVTWRRCCFHESQCQGCANMTQCQKSWQGQHFVNAMKSGGNFAKIVLFELCKIIAL